MLTAPPLNLASQPAVLRPSKAAGSAASSLSFTDTLASVQAAANGSQNGMPFSAALKPQLQNGTPLPIQNPGGQSAKGNVNLSSSLSSATSGTLQQQNAALAGSSTSLIAPASLNKPVSMLPADGISADVKTTAAWNSGQLSGQTQDSGEAEQAAYGLSTRGNVPEKSKQRKESISALPSADAIPGTNASADAAGVLLQPIINSAVVGVSSTTTQAGEPTLAAGSSRVKGASANAGLAFAVKIQGNVSLGDNPAGLNNTRTTAPVPADPAQPDEQASAGGFAPQLANTAALTAPKIAKSIASTNDSAALDLSAGNPNPTALLLNRNAKSASEVVPAAEVAQPPSASGQSVKTLQVQITGENNQTVDLRLMEKSGALTMSVRSADGTLTRALQQHLPDLTAKLSDQRMQAEWWRPDVQKVDSSQKQSNSSDSNSSDRNDSASSQDKGNQGKGNSGEQGGRNTDEPDWLTELTALRKSNQNGSQYSWHL